MEIWKEISGYEGLYEVSDLGRVRNARTGKQKTLCAHVSDGRFHVMLYRDNTQKFAKVHRLVMCAFNGPPPIEGLSCCHNDGVHTNNVPSNLRWDTHLANMQDSKVHGTYARGERTGTSKLKPEQVLAIRADTRRHIDIAADYGVCRATIGYVKTKGWEHLR